METTLQVRDFFAKSTNSYDRGLYTGRIVRTTERADFPVNLAIVASGREVDRYGRKMRSHNLVSCEGFPSDAALLMQRTLLLN